jgi:outer membrane protein assembly factor BamE (lipoprotein component of BamABCDE complex)
MHRSKPSVAILALALAGLLGACSARVSNNGNMVSDERLQALRVGQTSEDEVLRDLGTPTAVATFDRGTWYYVGQVTSRFGPFRPEAIERRVVTVRFDDAGVVSGVETRSLADGNEVAVIDRATATPGTELSLIQQIFGNVGRFPGVAGGTTRGSPGRTGP